MDCPTTLLFPTQAVLSALAGRASRAGAPWGSRAVPSLGVCGLWAVFFLARGLGSSLGKGAAESRVELGAEGPPGLGLHWQVSEAGQPWLPLEQNPKSCLPSFSSLVGTAASVSTPGLVFDGGAGFRAVSLAKHGDCRLPHCGVPTLCSVHVLALSCCRPECFWELLLGLKLPLSLFPLCVLLPGSALRHVEGMRKGALVECL